MCGSCCHTLTQNGPVQLRRFVFELVPVQRLAVTTASETSSVITARWHYGVQTKIYTVL